MAKIKRQEILKISFATLIMLISSIAQIDGAIRLNMGVYLALINCNFAIAMISPLYIGSCLFKGLELANIIYAVAPVALSVIIKVLNKYIKKGNKLFFYIAVIVVSSVIVTTIDHSMDIVSNIAQMVINVVIFIVNSIIFYPLFVRESIYNLSLDEKACGFVLIGILTLGVYSINILGFRIAYVVIGALTIYLIDKNNLPTSTYVISAIGFRISLFEKDISSLGALLVAYYLGVIFYKINKYLSAAAIILSTLAFRIYFNSYMNYNYYYLIGLSSGLIIYLILPKKVRNKLVTYKNCNKNICVDNLIRRDKYDLINKLNMAESVIYEMAQGYLTKGNLEKREDVLLRLSKEVALCTCDACQNREECYKSLNMSPEFSIRSLIDMALINDEVTIKDVPFSMNNKCINLCKILSDVNSLVKGYKNKINNQEEEDKENRFFSMQMAGIGSILGSITKTIKDFPVINEKLEELLKAELGYSNIWCKEALFLSNKEKNIVAVIVKLKDKDNPQILQIINELLHDKLIQKDESLTIESNLVCIFFESRPRYEVAYQNIIYSKNGSIYSGDTHSIIKIKDNKVLLILCDGMGSGQQAQETAKKTLSLVQDFYRAGLDNTKSLILVNRALACLNRENFTAVDMCVVDLNNASVDFIKLGGVASFIKRNEGVKVINTSALPLGIIDKIKPNITRELLTINDIAVLVSDGILDVLKIEGISEILTRLKSSNPKTVCDEILGQAKLIGLNDDASVIAFKIYEKS